MALESPTKLNENTIVLAGQEDACNLNAVAGTEKNLVDAVPTGLIFNPVMVILDEFSGACAAAVVTFGIAGGACDEFLGDQTLTNISAAGDFVICQPVPNATPVKLHSLVAGEVFAMEITTAEGGALTCRASVMGIYKKA